MPRGDRPGLASGPVLWYVESVMGSAMWRFVHISDPHLGSQTDGQWNNRFLCTMMPDVMRCLKRDLAKLKPDFLLVTGDIASQQTRDAMFAARDLMDGLGFPYYPMGGNHDFAMETSREWFLEAFYAHLPDQDTVYSFTHKNLHFCVLDPWWQWKDASLCPFSEKSVADSLDVAASGAQWAVPPHQFAWLEEDLDSHKYLPAIIAAHYPAIPIPPRLVRPGIKDAGHLTNGSLLIEVLQQHPQVKAIMTGHIHMHCIESWDGITHVGTGALPEFPAEYRDVHVYDDRIEVHTCSLSDPSFAARSLIPGKDWTAGESGDRATVIRLK